MKIKLLLPFVSLLISLTGFAQTTLIPDINFEQALIDEGYEIGPPDGSMENWRISGVSLLYINNKGITNLTGIEAFSELIVLNVNDNQITNLNLSNHPYLVYLFADNNLLTSLNISGSPNLEFLNCSGNQLTNLNVTQNGLLEAISSSDNALSSLDISNNAALEKIFIANNQLTNIDVSNNISLTVLVCGGNQLTSLDISQNTSLTWFNCSNNQLSSLNAKNGNNLLLTTSFDSTNNPSLSCIQVDNEIDANNNISPYDSWSKDAFAIYSENCLLSIENEILNEGLNLYPNPTSDWLIVKSKLIIHKIEIYSVLGNKIKEINSDFSIISFEDISAGLYMIHIFSENGTTIRKIIKK